MTVKRKKRGRVILSLIAVLLIAAMTFGGICIYLAFQDNIQSKYTLTETTDTFLSTLLKGAVFGKEFEISETEINSYINEKYCTQKGENEAGLDHVRIDFHEGGSDDIYAHIYYKSYELAAHSKILFSLDEQTSILSAKLYNAYIGELRISENILSYLLSKIFENSEHITVNGTTLSVTASYTYDIKNTDGITLSLKHTQSTEDSVKCRTNSLTGEALKAAGEYLISEEGREAVSGIWGDIKNKVSTMFNVQCTMYNVQ